MVYQGDTYTFLLVLKGTNGANPNVSGTPTITVINSATNTAVVTAQNMSLIPGTQAIYKFAWAIPANQTQGKYVAIASYSVDLSGGATFVAFTGVYVDDILVGDSMIQGKVALDSTVAKDGTVAKDSSVAHANDLISLNPSNSSVVLAIKNKTDNLPATPADGSTLTSIQSMVQSVLDATLATVRIDKTVTPNTLTIKRFGDNAILAVYNLTDDGTATAKTRTA